MKTEFLASDAPAVDPECPELMIAESPLDLASFSALVVGPGMGTGEKSVKRLLDAIHCEDTPLVLDADALTILAEKPELQEDVYKRQVQGHDCPGLVLKSRAGKAGKTAELNIPRFFFIWIFCR